MNENIENAIADVEQIADPFERAQRSAELLSSCQSGIRRLARIRRDAIAELQNCGHTHRELADRLGLSRGRIGQLKQPIEQTFYGNGAPAVTIVTPLRTSITNRPVVAYEDHMAATTIARRLNDVGMDVQYGHATEGGEIDLSPSGLVVICGPKSSSTMRQIINADPVLQFTSDPDNRWYLTERATGVQHQSPTDDPNPIQSDIAYLARLPRENAPPMLIIAGIHAIGSLGVAKWLTSSRVLHDLYRDIGTQLFSMIIQSDYGNTPMGFAITSACPITPPLLYPTST